MESLLDEVDSLITPGLSTETPEWCSNCQSLKQEIKRLQEEQIQNFGKLKQKIISTDLLIKKYKSKCDERNQRSKRVSCDNVKQSLGDLLLKYDYDVQCKRNEEANKRADKYQRQCEILETQLKAALLDTEPLRKTKMTLEAEIRLKNAELQSMSDRMLAVESAQKQYEHLSKASSIDIDKLEAEKKDLLAKIKSMEAGKLTKEAAKEFKHEISILKKEKAAMVKNEKRLESKLSGALTRIEHLTTVVKERKFSPKRRRTASGNLSSPLKSPTRSPRGLSPRESRPSPKGQGLSRTLSERKSESHTKAAVIPPPSDGKLASESSSSSEDSDDCESLCSVSWTFSPLMKCLSPLPPSPACFAERKMKRQEDSVEADDEGEVSDIADVLEQQLLEDDTQQQLCLTSDDIGDKNIENVKDSGKETSRKFNGEQKIEDSTKTLETLEDTSNHLETVNAKSKVENASQQDKNYEPLKDRITDAFVAVEKRDGQQSLKEKLADSIIITSPTALRKRIAHQPSQNSKVSDKMITLDHNKNATSLRENSEGVERTSDRKIKKPPVRRSARINSQKDSEINEQESESSESKETSDKHVETSCNDNKRTSEDASQSGGNDSGTSKCDRFIYRNNTEEFSPSVSETLSDSDVDAKSNSISKNVLKVGEGDSNQADLRLGNDITNNSISSQNITDSIGTSEGENANKVNITSIRTNLNEIKTDGTEEDIEIWKEKETIEVRPVPTPKSCLQRQEVVNIVNKEDKHPTLHKDIEALKNKKGNETSSKKDSRKFGPDKFINFQKSSSGPVTNEFEDFSYVDDYEVLDRFDKGSKMMSPVEGGMHKKNVKRRLKRTCKYRDRDSEIFTENKEAISGVRNEQIDRKSSSDKPVKKESVKESREKMEVGHSVVSKEKNDNKKAGIVRENAIDGSEDMKLNSSSDKTGSRYLSQRSNEQQEQESKSICTTEIGVNDCIEPSVKTSVNVSEKEETVLKESKHNQISVKESLFEDKCDHLDVRMQLESHGSDNCSEKFTPNRQMSTGFMFSVPPYERVPSTDSSVSFGTSPSRLFNLETGTFDTIAEEEIGEEFDKDGNDKESNSKISSDSNLIFGVEDLLDVRKEESPPASQHLVNAQNITKPFCDINANTDNSSNAPEVDKTVTNFPGDTDSLSVVTFDVEESKPGCSYHYVEPSDQLLPDRVAEDTDAEKDGLQFERIPFVTETLQQDDSSSRSSMQSINSIDRASPLSPLSISPFDFLNPISPLPPSPIREIERVSPLSPEHVSDEQKSEIVDSEQDAIKDSEKDNSESVIKTNVNDNPKKLADTRKQISSLEKNSISQVEENSAGNNKENDNILQPEDYGGEKKSDFNICNKVKDTEMKENQKKVQKVPITPEKEAEFGEDTLKLFTLPQMISPVKTPKNQSRVKREQIKVSKSMSELTQNNKDKTETSSVVNIQFEKSLNKPKQFSTKAPESAIAVKPRPTRGRTSLDKSNIEMCIRKSSRTALKRVSSAERTDISAIKKVSVDAKCAAVEETPGYELESEKLDLKTINDTDKETGKVSGRTTENVEKLPVRKEDSREVGVKENAVEKVDEKGDNRVVEECPLSHDNLAFKRKARVAHKPKVQPLKPHKIQIIDAPVLPPVTVGRKRKTLENKKEAQDKKPCKESAFKKQKSSSSITCISAVNPEARKKMQTYLKSSEAAESFVSKFSPEVSNDELQSELLNVCLECLGRVQTDTLEVVYKTCENGQYLIIKDQFPYMSDVDKKAVELFQHLWTELKTDPTVVMRSIWDSIFSRDISTNIVGKMAQCRVFVALCSLQGDVEQARTLFYHLVTCGHLNCTLFIVSVVSVWPEMLKKDLSDRPDKVVSHGMTLVLEEVITKMLLSQRSEASNKILLILQKLCNWSGTAGNADSIIKLFCSRLLAVLDEENTDKSCEMELTKALELLCSHQNWLWFKEHFIMRHGLQTASNKYVAVKILKPVPPEYVCAILRITSRCVSALAASVKEREYQQIIRNWLLPILTHKPGDAKVRQCCVETLLELSPLYPTCLDSIHKWFLEERDNVSVEFTARLEFLRHQYKQKFGLQCKPFVKP